MPNDTSKLPTPVERARQQVHPSDNPTEPDPEAPTDELPAPVPETRCNQTGRTHRWVYSARRNGEVCGDCGAVRVEPDPEG